MAIFVSAEKFRPSLDTLRFIRDKAKQKHVLSELQIPSAPYDTYSGPSFHAWFEVLRQRFPAGVVLKWGEGGYDGKGVWPLENEAEALAFCENAIQRGVSLYAEEKITFRRELAILGCLSVTGEFVTYPLVVSEQWKGICRRVTGPATALGVSPKHEDLARAYAEKLARHRELYGCFAMEFFETQRGDLLVNEIAPRVHNSGHYTQDSAATSQFENHWRAVLGMPLGKTETAPAFVMHNLLGPDGFQSSEIGVPLPAPHPDGHLHWYDKKEVRPGRKLGHVNSLSDSKKVQDLSKDLENVIKKWEEMLLAKKS